jgi:hypothetical protein
MISNLFRFPRALSEKSVILIFAMNLEKDGKPQAGKKAF